MSINFKPINEVPVVESLSDGDKLLVNSNGAAKQIDASKVGGSGGGGVFYAASEEGDGAFMIHADKELTKPLTFAEGMAVLESGPVVIYLVQEEPVFFYPLMVQPMAEANACMVVIFAMTEMAQGALIFSDTVLD